MTGPIHRCQRSDEPVLGIAPPYVECMNGKWPCRWFHWALVGLPMRFPRWRSGLGNPIQFHKGISLVPIMSP
jgi:hypothetical protein